MCNSWQTRSCHIFFLPVKVTLALNGTLSHYCFNFLYGVLVLLSVLMRQLQVAICLLCVHQLWHEKQQTLF